MTREYYVIVIPDGPHGAVRLMGDEKGRPYRSLSKAEAAANSRSIWQSHNWVLGIDPWSPEIEKRMSNYHTNRWYTDMGKREGHRCENCHLPAGEHYNGRCPITDADREDMAEAKVRSP